jgi:molybdopterin molybdotransferase
MTGAAVPQGADRVVPVEDTDFPYRDPESDLPKTVGVTQIPPLGNNIRPRGQDVKIETTILHKGHLLQPQDTGMLSTMGLSSVSVHRKPHIALFSSGDELLAPGEPLTPGKIYDSNSYALSDLSKREGALITYLGVAPDQEEKILEKFTLAVQAGVDLILTSAGVSVGAFDYVRKIIEDNGQLDLWRVNMRPGKPLAYGSFQNTPVISLPGNPVSAFIGFLVFIRPVLKKLSGILNWQPKEILAVTEETIHSDGRESYLRAILTTNASGFSARLTGHQGSGNLYSLVKANALLIVPAGVKSIPAGTIVKTWSLNSTLD